jgi:hypothetical protein
MKTTIVYFSKSGNTRGAAEAMAQELDAPSFSVNLVEEKGRGTKEERGIELAGSVAFDNLKAGQLGELDEATRQEYLDRAGAFARECRAGKGRQPAHTCPQGRPSPAHRRLAG